MVSFDHVAVEVSDLDGTVAFYEGAFDMDREREFVDDGGARHVFVRGEDGRGFQFREAADDVSPSGIDHFGVLVGELDARLDHLDREWGIGVDMGPLETPDGGARVAFVEDPGGYTVELVELRE